MKSGLGKERHCLYALEEEFEMGVEQGILDKVNSKFFFSPLRGTLPSEKQSKALTVVSALGNVSTPLGTDHSHLGLYSLLLTAGWLTTTTDHTDVPGMNSDTSYLTLSYLSP